MRRFVSVALPGLVVALISMPSGFAMASGSGSGSLNGWPAYRAAQAYRTWLGLGNLAPSNPAAGVPATPRGVAAFDHVAHVQQVSQDTLPSFAGAEPDTQVEPDIAIDPNNPNVVVATFQQGRFPYGASIDPGYATSTDGGAHWTKGDLPQLTRVVGGIWDRASDPAVAFGPDGVVYISTLTIVNFPNCRSGIAIQRSVDHGLTFGPPILVQDDVGCNAPFNDKNWVTVDDNPSSPHDGRIYVPWSQFGHQRATAVLRYSDDGGFTWSPLIQISDRRAHTEGCLPLVQPNGDVTVVYNLNRGSGPFHGRSTIVASTSHDGGQSWDAPVLIDDNLGTGVGLRVGGLPTAAVDPVTGDLYASWEDGRYRTDGLSDVLVWRSTDGGATWTGPVKVNPDAAGSGLYHFTPDVAAYGGNVFMVYRTVPVTPSQVGPFVDMDFASSTDGGTTWSGELKLGPRTDLRYAAIAPVPFLGDYMGVAAWGDTVQTVWNRSSKPPFPHRHYHQTTWEATITAS